MSNKLLLESILALPQEELRIFISKCISESQVFERMDFYLMIQNSKYENNKKELKKQAIKEMHERRTTDALSDEILLDHLNKYKN